METGGRAATSRKGNWPQAAQSFSKGEERLMGQLQTDVFSSLCLINSLVLLKKLPCSRKGINVTCYLPGSYEWSPHNSGLSSSVRHGEATWLTHLTCSTYFWFILLSIQLISSFPSFHEGQSPNPTRWSSLVGKVVSCPHRPSVVPAARAEHCHRRAGWPWTEPKDWQTFQCCQNPPKTDTVHIPPPHYLFHIG